MASPAGSPGPAASRAKSPPLAPLTTSGIVQRRMSAKRPNSMMNRRVSSYSSTGRSIPPTSRPLSTVFPAFHSSLSYTIVRDFAYPWGYPMHYGPQPEDDLPTPASEAYSRRLSDPEIDGWEDSRNQWSAAPSWTADQNQSRDQLPAMTFRDGGPPYSEDEDLQSPVVTSSRHKKHKSERGRSPGAAGPYRASVAGNSGGRVEQYHPSGDDELDGPGGEIETFNATYRPQRHRDSNFAKPLRRDQSPYDDYGRMSEEEEDVNSDEDGRYSKDYSFTIVSPDEEMNGKAVALFDFESEHTNELPLTEGQIVLISYRKGAGWLVAEDPRTGESGLVPEEFVRLLKEIEGGIHGLAAAGLDDEDEENSDMNDSSNNNNNNNSNTTHNGARTGSISDSNEDRDRPPVQSNFSITSRDFSPIRQSASSSKPELSSPDRYQQLQQQQTAQEDR